MKKSRGFIALTSVLILSAIFLSISISVASRAISGSDTAIVLYERDVAYFRAVACVEYGLMELQRTLHYEGEEGILVGDGICNISIGGEGNENRTLQAESIVNEHVTRIEVIVEEVSPTLIISSQEEVDSF